MSPRKFFIGRAIGFIVLLIIAGIIAGFYALNNYIYNEKQGDSPTPIAEVAKISEVETFVWKYEKANSLNPDGNPQTKVFLEIKYFNGKVQNKLIDTTDGSCNDLPNKEAGSVPNGANIECYYAGLGYRYKITKGIDSYQVQRKAFEEALPDHTPPLYKYEVVEEFPSTN